MTLLLLLLLFNKLCIIVKTTSYKNLYENKVVDPSEKRSCVKFISALVTVLPKMAKNKLSVFHNFTFLGFLTSKMTSKLKFDLIRPTYFGGAQFFFF